MSFNEWKEYSFYELIDIIGGGTPKTTVEEYWNGHIPWLSVKDFNTDNRTVYETEKTITELGLQKSSTKLLNKGDLIISARGTVGALAQLGRQMAFNQSCYGLRANSKTTNDFLYYLLKYKLRSIQSNTHGSVFNTITKDTFKILKAIIPINIEEQKAISKILSDLDEKIEINNKINKKLEEMAQAIFKQWFIDFEFPNEDGKPYKSSGGEMVESELGMIPKGWDIKTLLDIAEFQNGYAFYKEGYSNVGVKVIDLANVNALGNFVETNKDKFISYELYNQEKLYKYRLKKNDLIIIMTDRTQDMNILGKTAKVPFDDKYILNQRVGRIRAKNDINENFLMSYMNSQIVLNELKSKSLGSVQKYFNTTHIKELKFIVPNKLVMSKYSDIINPLYDKMHESNVEISKLIEIRDILLPKLMSGEIRVPMD